MHNVTEKFIENVWKSAASQSNCIANGNENKHLKIGCILNENNNRTFHKQNRKLYVTVSITKAAHQIHKWKFLKSQHSPQIL